jgi:hypothetical protein
MKTPASPSKEFHILNLGAGVQSTTLYLMFMRGEIKPQIDCAIFADTQEEPGAVYRHLEWLQSLKGPEIIVKTAGSLGNDLISGRRVQGAGQARFASIPSFTTADNGATPPGRTRRQCSREYKTDVIARTIRYETLGLQFRARVPKTTTIHQHLGISLDEAGRARRITDLFARKQKWSQPHFELVQKFWTRADCLRYLADKVPHQTPRSACVFCPYHSDAEWMNLRDTDESGWKRALQIDCAIRDPKSVVNRDSKQVMYLHRSCKPLDQVAFDTRPRPRDLQLSMSFAAVCEGVCGV